MKQRLAICLVWLMICLPSALQAAVSDFEERGLPPDSYYNGSDGAGGFSSGDAFFVNLYNPEWDAWEGFALSTMTDTETPGFTNQYSAIAGAGIHGSTHYAVGFAGFSGPPVVHFTGPTRVSGAYFTNTTYAYLSMLEGDMFAKKFGGETGDDPDWFLLTITGKDADGNTTGQVLFYLADFRFEDPARDYLIDRWTWVDLSALGEVQSLEFTLSSSDVGEFGMNTPAFFAMDFLNPFVKVIGFEEHQLPPESFYNGADGAGGFVSGRVHFNNLYNADWGAWEGFALSTMTDTETPGFTNQYSAIAGAGIHGSTHYAVGFAGFSGPPAITFPEPTSIYGVYLTNATYPYLSMLEGDMFAKKFGGETGDDPDWFLLTITGKDADGNTTGQVLFYLADFRFEDPARDYLIDRWTWVDLSALGEVQSLEFTLSSSDVGEFGMNTPAFFCLDALSLPPKLFPVLDLRVNGEEGPLAASSLAPLAVTASLDPGDFAGLKADWWLYQTTQWGTFWWRLDPDGSLRYSRDQEPLVRFPLLPFQAVPLLENVSFLPGIYTYGLAVDDNADGLFNATWFDEVAVQVHWPARTPEP